jgi:hypothetical protein
MISRTYRVLTTWDRAFFFAVMALIAALAGSVFLLVGPVYQGIGAGGSTGSATFVEVNGWRVVWIMVLPLLVTGAPLVVVPKTKTRIETRHKVNSLASTVMLFLFCGVGICSFGLIYAPALIFSIASSVSLYFGKDRKHGADGVRLSRRARSPDQLSAGAGQPGRPETSRRGKGGGRRRGRDL